MGIAVFKVLSMLAIPIVVFVAAGSLMMNLTGRNQFAETEDPSSIPLNLRWKGYSEKAATDYWVWLRNNGALVAEQRFLKADLIFPFFYAGAMLTSVVVAWYWLKHSFDPKWAAIPIAITALADWAENLVHLDQLGYFIRNEPLQTSWMQVASVATVTKSVFLVTSAVLILGLVVCVVLHSDSASK